MSAVSRRDFVKLGTRALLAASGVLGLGALLRLLAHPAAPSSPTEFDLGLASQYPPGSRTVLPDIPVLVLHTPAGFSALSLTCTHLGCTLEQSGDGFACPCHGSLFDAQGVPQRGPAAKPLPALRVEQNAAGHLILSTIQEVLNGSQD